MGDDEPWTRQVTRNGEKIYEIYLLIDPSIYSSIHSSIYPSTKEEMIVRVMKGKAMEGKQGRFQAFNQTNF